VAAFCLALGMLVSSYASVQKPSGLLDGYYKDMQPGKEGGVKHWWVKPGVDLSKYGKVMLGSVVFYFAPDSQDKGIDPALMKALADSFNLELVKALSDKYPIVVDPGPGVVRIKIALTGIKQSRPVLSGITSVTPAGLAINAVNKSTGGSWTGSGATNVELMAIDPMTNEVVAVASDEQTAGFTERFSKLGSANEAFKFLAHRLRAFIDHTHGVQQ
jgi:hypothetical protein